MSGEDGKMEDQTLNHVNEALDHIRTALGCLDSAAGATGHSPAGREVAVAKTDLEKVERWLAAAVGRGHIA